jgi:hypothetical protein
MIIQSPRAAVLLTALLAPTPFTYVLQLMVGLQCLDNSVCNSIMVTSYIHVHNIEPSQVLCSHK